MDRPSSNLFRKSTVIRLAAMARGRNFQMISRTASRRIRSKKTRRKALEASVLIWYV